MTLKVSNARASETPDDRQARLASDVARHATQRVTETSDDREARLAANTHRMATQRSVNTVEENTAVIRERRQQKQNFMRMTWDPLKGIGFRYDPSIEYNNHGLLTLGRMIQNCRYCEALKWKGEPLGICCSNREVKLPLIPEPLDPLKTLLIGKTPHSKAFINKTRKYNSCFQITSFGTSGQVVSHNYPATFTVQGQIYHRIGSMLLISLTVFFRLSSWVMNRRKQKDDVTTFLEYRKIQFRVSSVCFMITKFW